MTGLQADISLSISHLPVSVSHLPVSVSHVSVCISQMDALTMKKELTNSQLDLKQQEALHHYHRLSNLIVQ